MTIENEAISKICHFVPAFSFLPPDVNEYWTPEGSDSDGLPKATAVHLAPLSNESCDPWKRAPYIDVSSCTTSVGASKGTCTVSNHLPQPPACPPLSHDLSQCPPDSAIPEQHTTSHGHPE